MNKINQLIKQWPRGVVLTTAYLSVAGVSKQLVNRYKKSQWIESVGQGAFKLKGDTVEWFGALYAIQKQLKKSIHAGGKTALGLTGLVHFLPKKIDRIFLYGNRTEKLPQWFRNYNWGISYKYSATNLFPVGLDKTFSEYPYRDFSIRISGTERAAMEMLYHVPERQTFEEAFLIMENLITLRPEIVQELLENCNSVKVKRLFMFMADKHKHPWVEDIKLTKVDFGKGKRVIFKNGILDKKYLITIPAEK